MITIIDYGLGNLASVKRAFNHLNKEVLISSNPEDILKAEKLVLPGVGAFGQGMENLNSGGLAEAIKESVNKNIPLLGICLGMQLLFSESEEMGNFEGLNLIPGKVLRLKPDPTLPIKFKVPHVGWSEIFKPSGIEWDKSILNNINEFSKVYFVHSFAAKTEDKDVLLSQTEYGGEILCSAVQKNRIVGCQFHPEKSGPVGLEILKNFIEWR
ncbi:MAG: imidazole glycerol phosphate synthase subunit HisH [Leptospiraceae bacterium]|nr:imidazole glycerol phosphate synthase subunit HisH [Leptospiraceae bacterium]